MSQPRLQGRRVPGRLQPGARVPGGGGEDGHLPQAGVEAAQEAGPAGGLVGRGLAEDLVSEQRAQSSAQLQAGTPAPGRGEEENQEPAVSQSERGTRGELYSPGWFVYFTEVLQHYRIPQSDEGKNRLLQEIACCHLVRTHYKSAVGHFR